MQIQKNPLRNAIKNISIYTKVMTWYKNNVEKRRAEKERVELIDLFSQYQAARHDTIIEQLSHYDEHFVRFFEVTHRIPSVNSVWYHKGQETRKAFQKVKEQHPSDTLLFTFIVKMHEVLNFIRSAGDLSLLQEYSSEKFRTTALNNEQYKYLPLYYFKTMRELILALKENDCYTHIGDRKHVKLRNNDILTFCTLVLEGINANDVRTGLSVYDSFYDKVDVASRFNIVFASVLEAYLLAYNKVVLGNPRSTTAVTFSPELQEMENRLLAANKIRQKFFSENSDEYQYCWVNTDDFVTSFKSYFESATRERVARYQRQNQINATQRKMTNYQKSKKSRADRARQRRRREKLQSS